jgi:hypothetical protein
MNFVIKTHTKQPTRQKQVADTSHVDMSQVSISDNVIAKVADINKKDMFNNRNVEKSDLLMNVTEAFDITTGEKNFISEAIYATSYYIDSSGDLVKTAHINGVKCVLVELCDKSIAEIEHLCSLNIIDDTNVRNSSGIQRVRVNIHTTDIQLCKVTLGMYRNYLQKLDIKGNRTTYQDAQNKTVYETIIMCPESDIERITKMIKSINKSNMIIEWYR